MAKSDYLFVGGEKVVRPSWSRNSESESFISINYLGVTTGAGGHYISIRRDFPREDQFSSSGFNQIKESGSLINHPHYVVFKN